MGRAETDRGTAPNGAGPLDTRGVPKDQEGTDTTGPAAGLAPAPGSDDPATSSASRREEPVSTMLDRATVDWWMAGWTAAGGRASKRSSLSNRVGATSQPRRQRQSVGSPGGRLVQPPQPGQLRAGCPVGQNVSTRCPVGQKVSVGCPVGQLPTNCPVGQKVVRRLSGWTVAH